MRCVFSEKLLELLFVCFVCQVVAKIPEYIAEAPKALDSVVSLLVDTVNSVRTAHSPGQLGRRPHLTWPAVPALSLRCRSLRTVCGTVTAARQGKPLLIHLLSTPLRINPCRPSPTWRTSLSHPPWPFRRSGASSPLRVGTTGGCCAGCFWLWVPSRGSGAASPLRVAALAAAHAVLAALARWGAGALGHCISVRNTNRPAACMPHPRCHVQHLPLDLTRPKSMALLLCSPQCCLA